MDVTNTAEPTEWEHPVQVSTALLSESVESEFDGNAVRSAAVTFRPGERTKFHTHAGVQVLYVIEGEGIVATRDEERAVSSGDLIVFPPGEEHWHGNTTDATEPFTHVYFLAERGDGELTVLEEP
ncbi:cupin domain-containing protein [Natrialbaceae archaeon AArc-T1-2]|uniref:cupin domain-containing protein n=1 Tax=Natrialbaceae archaeon AArc-T1-2 TaxID=3053904 RepID=UPI00255B3A00|nr:cupin domain-containing protein [Natrialbaceae archaeon AArc-T1-2]WIV68481.1 cupin domain-containing protein [Natrialbaceae archaeon AArc-T1-2]